MTMKKLLGIIPIFAVYLTLICVAEAVAAPQQMKVYQPRYNFDFDVYRTADMQVDWYKTYDEYYVTIRADGNWIYGKTGSHGLTSTNIVVGSVNPADVAELNAAPVHVYHPPASGVTHTLQPQREFIYDSEWIYNALSINKRDSMGFMSRLAAETGVDLEPVVNIGGRMVMFGVDNVSGNLNVSIFHGWGMDDFFDNQTPGDQIMYRMQNEIDKYDISRVTITESDRIHEQFMDRINDFTDMLGEPQLKMPLMAEWIIGNSDLQPLRSLRIGYTPKGVIVYNANSITPE